MANDCPKSKKQSRCVEILLCLLVHKLILVILHLFLLWFAYTVIKLSEELTDSLKDLRFMIGDLTQNAEMLRIASIVLIAVTVLFGIPALLTGIRLLLKLHMINLTKITWFLALYMLALYMGYDSLTISHVNARYTTAFEKARDRQDIQGIHYVMKIERYMKCCGFNSSRDYPVAVMESCCDTDPPCLAKDIHKVGCAEALDKRLGVPMNKLVSVLSHALIFMVFLLVYLFFFAYLLYRKRAYKKNKALDRNQPEENV